MKYGVTTDYVLGLDVVLADGTLVTLGGKRIKDVAGLSLLKLFVGSEGTLGHRDPGDPAAGAGAGDTVDPGRDVPDRARGGPGGGGDALDDAAVPVRADGPSASINAVEDYRPMGLDREAGALLLTQSDAPGEARGLEMATMEAACQTAGADRVLRHRRPRRG